MAQFSYNRSSALPCMSTHWVILSSRSCSGFGTFIASKYHLCHSSMYVHEWSARLPLWPIRHQGLDQLLIKQVHLLTFIYSGHTGWAWLLRNTCYISRQKDISCSVGPLWAVGAVCCIWKWVRPAAPQPRWGHKPPSAALYYGKPLLHRLDCHCKRRQHSKPETKKWTVYGKNPQLRLSKGRNFSKQTLWELDFQNKNKS